MPEIPNTESMYVSSLAIAWEIVKITYNTKQGTNKKYDLGLVELTNAVIKAQQALFNVTPIDSNEK